LLTTSSEPANGQAEADKRKIIARDGEIERLDLITGWIFAGKKKKGMGLETCKLSVKHKGPGLITIAKSALDSIVVMHHLSLIVGELG